MSFAKDVWLNLASVDCSDKIEKKMNLSYLSWAWAWAVLMDKYPESTYLFDNPVVDNHGTVEVWCTVTIKDGDKSISRKMWLPVMDHKNNSIINPTSRQVSDTRMRCLTKCLAMFGLGHYVYAGEDIPDPLVSEAATMSRYNHFVKENQESIDAIKNGINSGDLYSAAEAWYELDDDTKQELWRAPKKGGCFSTSERKVMTTSEFRQSYYGDDSSKGDENE